MKNVLEELKAYFATTPQEQIDADWASVEKFDQVGIPVNDFLCRSKFLVSFKEQSLIRISNIDNPKFASDFFLPYCVILRPNHA